MKEDKDELLTESPGNMFHNVHEERTSAETGKSWSTGAGEAGSCQI